jgi:hypothetical protein
MTEQVRQPIKVVVLNLEPILETKPISSKPPPTNSKLVQMSSINPNEELRET